MQKDVFLYAGKALLFIVSGNVRLGLYEPFGVGALRDAAAQKLFSDALLLKYIEDSRHIWEGNLPQVRYTTVGSVIGTHAGPGAVVVAFFKK